jgi:Tfp pilus assembly protein PilE
MRPLGMSKIEILIVAAIIGVLGLAAVVAVSTARSRTRDAVRLGDVFQVQTALEYHFLDHNAYPGASEALPIGSPAVACLSTQGWSSTCEGDEEVYLGAAPFIPTSGLKGLSVCDGYSNAYCYVSDEEAYRIEFELEHNNALLELEKGLNCATEEGISSGTCQTLP